MAVERNHFERNSSQFFGQTARPISRDDNIADPPAAAFNQRFDHFADNLAGRSRNSQPVIPFQPMVSSQKLPSHVIRRGEQAKRVHETV